MSKLRLFLLTGFLAAAVAPLYGCGNECGPGLTEDDGQCVVVAEGCGEGTVLSDKQCIVNDTGCGVGTILDDGECVPDKSSCADGTSFDQHLRVCVANTDIMCGEGTEAGANNVCVPSADACDAKTRLDDNGRCVIGAASCGEGTALAPNSGECILADVGCGEGLALDAESGTCVPTAQVCDAGTVFDTESGLCLPDACQEGDVLVDGICMNPAEELAHDADLQETENNDPTLGGTANAFEPNGVGEAAFVISGTISAPDDLDADGTVDQDVDSFSFDAGAGEWFELMVQSAGLPAPAFKIEGPSGYVRYSQTAGARQVARDFVLPKDGTYTVTVLPSHVLEHDQDFAPVGDDSWTYVASLEAVSAPTPVDADISSGSTQFDGELLELSDNVFRLTGLSADETFTLTPATLSADVEAAVQIWADATTLHTSATIRRGQALTFGAPTGSTDALVIVDWIRTDGPPGGFDIEASVSGSQSSVTVAPGATKQLTVHANALDEITASHTNTSGARLDVAIKNSEGELLAGRRLDENKGLPVVVFEEGDYLVELTNNTTAALDATLMAKLTSPQDFGQIPEGGKVTSSPMRLPAQGKAYFKFSALAGEVLSLTHQNDDDAKANLTIFDPSGNQVERFTNVDPLGSGSFTPYDHDWQLLQSDVTWIVEVEALDVSNNSTLTVESIHPPMEGTISADSSLSFTNPASIAEGLSGFHLVEFTEPAGFYGAVTPTGGQDLDFYVYDLAGDEILDVTGISGGAKFFGGQIEAAGTYLVRVECDDACTGYDVDFNGYESPVDLGDIGSGQTVTTDTLPVFNEGQTLELNFNIDPGQVIEISHDNDEGTDHEMWFYDDNDAELAHEYSFEPVSTSSFFGPGMMYHYTANGGTFRLVLESDGDSKDEQVTIQVFEPRDLGAIGIGGSKSDTVFNTLSENQRFFHKVTFDDAAALGGSMLPADGEDLDVYLYDAVYNGVDDWTSGSGDVGFGGQIDTPGTYIFATECQDSQCLGFDLGVRLASATDALGDLDPDSSTTHELGEFSNDQTKDLSFSVPAGQLIKISHDNDEAQSLSMELLDAQGEDVIRGTSYDARSSSSAEFGYWYTKDGGEFTLDLEGTGLSTNASVTVDVSTPPLMGTLDISGTPLTYNVAESCVAGESFFGLVDFPQGTSFEATITPPGAETFNLYLYDQANEEWYNDDSGAVTFANIVARYAGEHLIRVECNDATSSFDVTLKNATSIEVDLGDVGTDNTVDAPQMPTYSEDQMTLYTFTVGAGQIVEISNDHDGEYGHEFTLYDSNREELASNGNMFPRTPPHYDDGEYLYTYSATGGSFSVLMRGRWDVNQQNFRVTTYTPNSVGAMTVAGGSVSAGNPSPMEANQRDYHLVELGEDGTFTVKAQAGNSVDIDLFIFDTDSNSVSDSTSSGGIDSSDELTAGTYLVAIEPDEDIPSYSAEFDLTSSTSSP